MLSRSKEQGRWTLHVSVELGAGGVSGVVESKELAPEGSIGLVTIERSVSVQNGSCRWSRWADSVER